MRRLTIILALGLIVIHLLAEAHSFVWTFFPNINDEQLNLFLKPHFDLKISVHWYIKMLMDGFYDVCLIAIICALAKQLSYPLFLVSFFYLIYRITDLFLFMWNYKQTSEIYIALAAVSTAAAIIVLMTKYKKLHIVK